MRIFLISLRRFGWLAERRQVCSSSSSALDIGRGPVSARVAAAPEVKASHRLRG